MTDRSAADALPAIHRLLKLILGVLVLEATVKHAGAWWARNVAAPRHWERRMSDAVRMTTPTGGRAAGHRAPQRGRAGANGE